MFGLGSGSAFGRTLSYPPALPLLSLPLPPPPPTKLSKTMMASSGVFRTMEVRQPSLCPQSWLCWAFLRPGSTSSSRPRRRQGAAGWARPWHGRPWQTAQEAPFVSCGEGLLLTTGSGRPQPGRRRRHPPPHRKAGSGRRRRGSSPPRHTVRREMPKQG